MSRTSFYMARGKRDPVSWNTYSWTREGPGGNAFCSGTTRHSSAIRSTEIDHDDPVPVLGQPRLPGSLPGDRLSKRIDPPPGSLKRATSISWFDLPGFGNLKRSWNWVKRCYAITIESVTKWFIEIYLRNQICRGWIQILGLG